MHPVEEPKKEVEIIKQTYQHYAHTDIFSSLDVALTVIEENLHIWVSLALGSTIIQKMMQDDRRHTALEGSTLNLFSASFMAVVFGLHSTGVLGSLPPERAL